MIGKEAFREESLFFPVISIRRWVSIRISIALLLNPTQPAAATQPPVYDFYFNSAITSLTQFNTSLAKTEAVVPRASAANNPAWAWINAPATAA